MDSSGKIHDQYSLRQKRDKRFSLLCKSAIYFAVSLLVVILLSLATRGLVGLTKTQIRLPISLDSVLTSPGNYNAIIKYNLRKYVDSEDNGQVKKLSRLISPTAAHELESYLNKDINGAGASDVQPWLTASSKVHIYLRGDDVGFDEQQVDFISELQKEGRVRTVFNSDLFLFADSRKPEYAGILAGLVGSLMVVMVCVITALPIGVFAAIYLNEFCKKSKMVEIIDVNIANLAAVPSIIFGLLGLVVFLQFMDMERSSSLVGGLTLAMMILPTIVVSSKAALQAVPIAIRDAARALGATEIQVVFHHVLPLAVPGIMTGLILGISRALGETAPLIMIGMVAFIADVPTNFLDPATVMPVQVYLWADHPNQAFSYKTASAILVLLVVLILLNAASVYIRRKFERKW